MDIKPTFIYVSRNNSQFYARDPIIMIIMITMMSMKSIITTITTIITTIIIMMIIITTRSITRSTIGSVEANKPPRLPDHSSHRIRYRFVSLHHMEISDLTYVIECFEIDWGYVLTVQECMQNPVGKNFHVRFTYRYPGIFTCESLTYQAFLRS